VLQVGPRPEHSDEQSLLWLAPWYLHYACSAQWRRAICRTDCLGLLPGSRHIFFVLRHYAAEASSCQAGQPEWAVHARSDTGVDSKPFPQSKERIRAQHCKPTPRRYVMELRVVRVIESRIHGIMDYTDHETGVSMHCHFDVDPNHPWCIHSHTWNTAWWSIGVVVMGVFMIKNSKIEIVYNLFVVLNLKTQKIRNRKHFEDKKTRIE
jgi:hypothetical protein